MNNKYQSEAMQVIHEDMENMHQLGIISDARMREFDNMCLAEESRKVQKAESFTKAEHLGHVTA